MTIILYKKNELEKKVINLDCYLELYGSDLDDDKLHHLNERFMHLNDLLEILEG